MITLTPSSTTPNTYSLNWSTQQSHIFDGLRNLVGQGDVLLTDVTLACDGEYIQAHKLVLSLCSAFFKDLFQKNCADKSNTIIILGNVSAQNVRHILQFMYQGRVDIPSKDVDSFLQAGNMLKVEGLIGNVNESSVPSTSTQQQQGSQNGATNTSTTQVAPPAPASKKVHHASSISMSRGDPTPSKKSRFGDAGTTLSLRSSIPHSASSMTMVVGEPVSLSVPSDKDEAGPSSTLSEGMDPLDESTQYSGELESEVEEGIDFQQLKTEPIHVYSTYEQEESGVMHHEGGGDEYSQSLNTSYGLSSPGVSVPVPIGAASVPVPGPSTNSELVSNRPRGSVPVILSGRFFEIVDADEVGRVRAKCMICCSLFSKSVLISGRYNPTSNFNTHLKRRHPEEYKAYELLLIAKGRRRPMMKKPPIESTGVTDVT